MRGERGRAMQLRMIVALAVLAACADSEPDAPSVRVEARPSGVEDPAPPEAVIDEPQPSDFVVAADEEAAGLDTDEAAADEAVAGEVATEAATDEEAPAADEGAADEALDEAEPVAGGPAIGAGAPGVDPSAGPELVQREGLHLTELVLATGIESRRPVDPRTTFSKAEHTSVYCYMRIANPERTETEVFLDWEPVDAPREGPGRAVRVAAQHQWVTFAYTRTGARPGRYRCVIRDAAGEILARAAYDLTD